MGILGVGFDLECESAECNGGCVIGMGKQPELCVCVYIEGRKGKEKEKKTTNALHLS